LPGIDHPKITRFGDAMRAAVNDGLLPGQFPLSPGTIGGSGLMLQFRLETDVLFSYHDGPGEKESTNESTIADPHRPLGCLRVVVPAVTSIRR
jgi:hypothetical protein